MKVSEEKFTEGLNTVNTSQKIPLGERRPTHQIQTEHSKEGTIEGKKGVSQTHHTHHHMKVKTLLSVERPRYECHRDAEETI